MCDKLGDLDAVNELAAIVGKDHVITDAAALNWAGADATGNYRLATQAGAKARPLAVVMPANAAETAATVRWAAARRIPIIARGAGTGVMGGAISRQPAIVIDTTRLNEIIVHPVDQLVEVGAGAVLAEVDAALNKHDLMLGHDPWSVGIATVGGAIGTNGLGYMGGRWGSMGDQVAGLEAVLADGSIVHTGPVRRSVGPDLRCLFVGSQGSFGIVTRAWLRAVPLPQRRAFAAYQFAGFEVGYNAVLALWRTGLRFDLFDMGDGRPDRLAVDPGLEDEQGLTAVLYLGAFGCDAEAQARLQVADSVLTTAGGRRLDPGRAELFWRGRHYIAERYEREIHRTRDCARRDYGKPGLDYLNVEIRPSRLLAYRRAALARIKREPGFCAGESGIWCRPEIFSLEIWEQGIDRSSLGQKAAADAERMERVLSDLLQLAVQHDGNIECIHGPGLKLLPLLATDLGSVAPVLRTMKAAMDPSELFNPGKLPT